MKSIIHIGPPKTGTTSIQKMLAHEEERLRDAGVLYFDTYRAGPSHNGLAMDLRRGEADAVADKLITEVRSGDYDTAILSSELFFSPWVSGKLSRALPRLLRRGALIVAYLRRHDLYFEAVYKQKLKTGQASVDPMEFLGGQKPGVYLFATSLKRTQGAFPQSTLAVREYNRANLIDGNVVADFIDATDLSGKVPDLKPDFESNPSISYAVCVALGELDVGSKAERRRVLRRMTAINHPNLNGSKDVLSRDQRRELLTKWEADNQELAQLLSPERARFFDFDLEKILDQTPADSERDDSLAWARAHVREVAQEVGVL